MRSDPPDPRYLRLVFDLEPNSEPISGLLHAADGRVQPFTGWLELAALLEDARVGGGVTGPENPAEPPA